MESYTLLYFHFFLLACFQGSVMFYRVSVLHSLVWLNNVPLFGSTAFCYPFINLCTFGWFPFFTLMNNGALSICVQFLMWMYVFISFGDITRHRIAESYGNSVFNILEELANCFPKWVHYLRRFDLFIFIITKHCMSSALIYPLIPLYILLSSFFYFYLN